MLESYSDNNSGARFSGVVGNSGLTVLRDLRLPFQLTPPISTAPKSGTSFAASVVTTDGGNEVGLTAPVRHAGVVNESPFSGRQAEHQFL